MKNFWLNQINNKKDNNLLARASDLVKKIPTNWQSYNENFYNHAILCAAHFLKDKANLDNCSLWMTTIETFEHDWENEWVVLPHPGLGPTLAQQFDIALKEWDDNLAQQLFVWQEMGANKKNDTK